MSGDIRYNRFHTLGLGVMHDMGGIHTTGKVIGLTVQHNVVYGIPNGWGIYTDNWTSDCVISDNLVYDCQGGYFNHWSRDNPLRNNIFAFVGKPVHGDKVILEGNIVLSGPPATGPFAGAVGTGNSRTDSNVFWNADGGAVQFPNKLDLKQWQEKTGQDKQSVVADPLFVDAAKRDFRLKPESPALKLGFKPFDYTKAGRTTPPVLTKDLPPVPRAYDERKYGN